jgi:hypothetical protein
MQSIALFFSFFTYFFEEEDSQRSSMTTVEVQNCNANVIAVAFLISSVGLCVDLTLSTPPAMGVDCYCSFRYVV